MELEELVYDHRKIMKKAIELDNKERELLREAGKISSAILEKLELDNHLDAFDASPSPYGLHIECESAVKSDFLKILFELECEFVIKRICKELLCIEVEFYKGGEE